MYYFAQHSDALSAWQAGADRRLILSTLLATTLLTIVGGFLRNPFAVQFRPFEQYVIDLILPGPPAVEERPAPPPEPVRQNQFDRAEVVDPAHATTTETVETPATVGETTVEAPGADWSALGRAAITEYLDAESSPVSMNPDFEHKRQAAASQFQPSTAPVKKPIWENVAKDRLGRTLLWSGNCYRVLDDPSAVNRWAFETFGQYLTICSNAEEYLIEFDEIPDRYAEP